MLHATETLKWQSFLFSMVQAILKWESNSHMHNTNHLWIRILMPYPLQPICYSLPVPDIQTLIKSCSIESQNYSSPKKEVVHETTFTLTIFYSTHVWVTVIVKKIPAKQYFQWKLNLESLGLLVQCSAY